jgi:hypothetical protein
MFDTVRISNLDEHKSGRLKGGFTDISINQLFYTSNLSANVGPKWKKEAVTDKVDCSVTCSWDNKFFCVECKGQKRHSIFNKVYFAIVITDQHLPTMLPAMDGVCMAVIRHQDLSVAHLLTHSVWMVADAAEKGVKPRSLDEQGACSALQLAIDNGKEIHLFISSGSGLISDQASGTSYQMQRGLDLISSGKAREG